MQHKFYNIQNISLEERIQIINYAKELSDSWRVDKLDCSENYHRQRIDMSFEEMMFKFDVKSHFVVVHRHDYDSEYGEIGFCTMATDINYYLWIFTTIDNLNKIISKYNLELK